MKKQSSNSRLSILYLSILFLLPLLLNSNLSAQSPSDFSGVWVQDKAKSDEFYRAFNVTCTIKQDQNTFYIKTVFTNDDGDEITTRESTFTLDGKVVTDKEGAKKSAKWSADKKSLTTSDTRDYGGDVVGFTATYSLSADKKVLTVKTSDIKVDAKNVMQVFNKKQ